MRRGRRARRLGAALSAARLGASVCLLERHGFLGGNFTAASVGAVCGLYVGDGSGGFRYVTGGIAREVALGQAAGTGAVLKLRGEDAIDSVQGALREQDAFLGEEWE